MADENASAASGITGMFNVFVDPEATAKQVPKKYFWLWPLLTVSIVFMVIGYLMLPFSTQLMEAKMAQQTIPPDRLETARKVGHTITYALVFVLPLFLAAMTALLAWLVSVTGSIVDLRVKFRDIFSLMAACSLISMLQYIATYIVLRMKGDEITSQDQMTPAFGLDIFVPAHGALLGFLNFFSIFQIWYLVMLGLSLAYLARTSKGKAFFAITPVWLIPLILRVVGAMFSGAGTPSS